MKKLIIALFGILVATGAICEDEPDRLKKPQETSVKPWWDKGTSYATDITEFYPEIEQEFSDNRFFERHGTWDDEGAIIIWAAREIYDHGAKFCPVQIQAANENQEWWIWLDYYWNTDDPKWNNCTTVCTSGYTGNKCAIAAHGKCPEEQYIPVGHGLLAQLFAQHNQRKFTNLPDWKSLRIEHTSTTTYQGEETTSSTNYVQTGDTYKQTTMMPVISFENGHGTEDSYRSANHVVLGVIDEIDNGVKVAPIKIVGHRSANGWGIKSWIQSAKSNGNGTLLCYDGYAPNNNDKCEKDPQCGNDDADSSDDDEDNNTQWCNGAWWSNYQQNHKDYKRIKVDGCYQYRCKGNNAFNHDIRHCSPCLETEQIGVNKDGFCVRCTGENQIFSKSANKCITIYRYTQKDMRQGTDSTTDNKCWMETDPDKFYDCVTGNSQN